MYEEAVSEGKEMTVRILVGDCRKILPQFPDDYFHCVVTSPPFWGLRDYGIPSSVWGGGDCEHEWGDEIIRDRRGLDTSSSTLAGPQREDTRLKGNGQFCQRCGAWRGCLGLEPTPELYVTHLVGIFREIKRVLRDDGTAWLDMGDSYNSQGGHTRIKADGRANRVVRMQMKGANVKNLKRKDLVGMPWRMAFALQADGWWLRSAIVWHKPNCMPESVEDRPTNDYEFMFLLTKSEQYFYDQEAIREPKAESTQRDGRNTANCKRDSKRGFPGSGSPNDGGTNPGGPTGGRNKRTVWTIPTYPYSEAHFATFPPALVEPCIKAGTSERGACPGCGAPWERVVKASGGTIGQSWHDHKHDSTQGVRQKRGDIPTGTFAARGWETYKRETIGFRPTCSCYDHHYRSEFPRARSARKRWQQDMADRWLPRVRKHPGKDEWPVIPCRVLDPFAGAGTTGMVADRLGRDAVLIDIKPEYCEMAHKRIMEDAGPMFAQITCAHFRKGDPT